GHVENRFITSLLDTRAPLSGLYAVEILSRSGSTGAISTLHRVTDDVEQPLITRLAAARALGSDRDLHLLESALARCYSHEVGRWTEIRDALWWVRDRRYMPAVRRYFEKSVVFARSPVDEGFRGFEELATVFWALGEPDDVSLLLAKFPLP